MRSLHLFFGRSMLISLIAGALMSTSIWWALFAGLPKTQPALELFSLIAAYLPPFGWIALIATVHTLAQWHHRKLDKNLAVAFDAFLAAHTSEKIRPSKSDRVHPSWHQLERQEISDLLVDLSEKVRGDKINAVDIRIFPKEDGSLLYSAFTQNSGQKESLSFEGLTNPSGEKNPNPDGARFLSPDRK